MHKTNCVGQNTTTERAAKIPLEKIDEEQRIVGGWAVLCTDFDGADIIDYQGDLLRVETLERAVNKAFMESSGQGKCGRLHQDFNKASVLQSSILSVDRLRKAGFNCTKGPSGWWVIMKVHCDKLWDEIKSGRLTELSIAGSARRIPINA